MKNRNSLSYWLPLLKKVGKGTSPNANPDFDWQDQYDSNGIPGPKGPKGDKGDKGDPGSGGGGSVDDVTVNGTSVLDNKVADIRLKTINNNAIEGEGNITVESQEKLYSDSATRAANLNNDFIDSLGDLTNALSDIDYNSVLFDFNGSFQNNQNKVPTYLVNIWDDNNIQFGLSGYLIKHEIAELEYDGEGYEVNRLTISYNASDIDGKGTHLTTGVLYYIWMNQLVNVDAETQEKIKDVLYKVYAKDYGQCEGIDWTDPANIETIKDDLYNCVKCVLANPTSSYILPEFDSLTIDDLEALEWECTYEYHDTIIPQLQTVLYDSNNYGGEDKYDALQNFFQSVQVDSADVLTAGMTSFANDTLDINLFELSSILSRYRATVVYNGKVYSTTPVFLPQNLTLVTYKPTLNVQSTSETSLGLYFVLDDGWVLNGSMSVDVDPDTGDTSVNIVVDYIQQNDDEGITEFFDVIDRLIISV